MGDAMLLIGEALIDVVRRPGQAAQRVPGGCAMNVAVGLGRLGHSPLLATWVGDDADGRRLVEHCAASGVRLVPGSDKAVRTSVAEALIDDEGKATYSFDIDWQLPPIPADLHPGLVHVGSIGGVLEPGGSAELAYVEAIRGQSFIAFDPNCRPALMGAPAQARAIIERYVAVADLVKASDEDLAWLYPEAGTDDGLLSCARRWASSGPAVVVVTLGSRGAFAVTRDQEVVGATPGWRDPATLPSPIESITGVITRHNAGKLRPLSDTIGAGDSFMAGLIHGMVTSAESPTIPDTSHNVPTNPNGHAVRAMRREVAVRSVHDDRGEYGFCRTVLEDPTALSAILTQAAAMAAITVSRPGADPPWAYELP